MKTIEVITKGTAIIRTIVIEGVSSSSPIKPLRADDYRIRDYRPRHKGPNKGLGSLRRSRNDAPPPAKSQSRPVSVPSLEATVRGLVELGISPKVIARRVRKSFSTNDDQVIVMVTQMKRGTYTPPPAPSQRYSW